MLYRQTLTRSALYTREGFNIKMPSIYKQIYAIQKHNSDLSW